MVRHLCRVFFMFTASRAGVAGAEEERKSGINMITYCNVHLVRARGIVFAIAQGRECRPQRTFLLVPSAPGRRERPQAFIFLKAKFWLRPRGVSQRALR